VNIGAICSRKNKEIFNKYHVHIVPTLRIYYDGMHLEYHGYGENFKIFDTWFKHKTELKEIIELKSKQLEKMKEELRHANHALIYYGNPINDANDRLR
jgi:hypothetical protein